MPLQPPFVVSFRLLVAPQCRSGAYGVHEKHALLAWDMHNKVIVVDRVGEVTYFADFDHHLGNPLAPSDRVRGCRWTVSRSSATEFDAPAEAARELSSSKLLGQEGVAIVDADAFPISSPAPRLGYPFSRVLRTSRSRRD